MPNGDQQGWKQVDSQYRGAFQAAQEVKNLPVNAGDAGSIPGLGKSPGKENGKSLQYSCLGNPMDRGAWLTTVHGVTKTQTRLSDFHTS